MFTGTSQFLPAAARFCRQIVPPVIATLIAAGLISTYNRSFSGHLSQPRMGGLNDVTAADGTTAPITTVAMTKAPAAPTAPVTETITIHEEVIAPERLWEKDAKEEAGKDQTPIKLAADPPPAPLRTASPAPKPEPKVEPRAEPHRVAAVEIAQPVVRAPVIVAVPPAVVAPPTSAPVVAAMPGMQEQRPRQVPRPYPPQVHPYPQPYQPYPPQAHQYPQPQVQQYPQPQYQPPPVIVGTPPMVTVPDRPNARPLEQAQAQPARPAQGAFGTFVHVLKPSTWFAHAREFGQKIEDAGNDILPSIRQ